MLKDFSRKVAAKSIFAIKCYRKLILMYLKIALNNFRNEIVYITLLEYLISPLTITIT